MTRSDPLFVGVDWATELHQVCVLDAQGAPLGERQVKHRGDELAALCAWLLELAEHQPDRVYVAIEVPHGAVVDTLLEQRFHVHAINPKQLDRFRDRFCASGAKDDRRDARVLADSLRTDRKAFRHLVADSAWTIELRGNCLVRPIWDPLAPGATVTRWPRISSRAAAAAVTAS